MASEYRITRRHSISYKFEGITTLKLKKLYIIGLH